MQKHSASKLQVCASNSGLPELELLYISASLGISERTRLEVMLKDNPKGNKV